MRLYLNTSYRNVILANVRVMSTEKTTHMELNEFKFDFYPVLEENAKWVDSVRIHLGYLEGLGADKHHCPF